MGRRLSTILSALSLLLFMAAEMLWVRSYWVSDFLSSSSHGGSWVIGATSHRGQFGVGFSNPPQFIATNGRARSFLVPKVRTPDWRYLGFAIENSRGVQSHLMALAIPYWFILGLSVILPVRWFRNWRRSRLAKREGLCPVCGYDLRASPERCPECGTPTGAQPTSVTGGDGGPRPAQGGEQR